MEDDEPGALPKTLAAADCAAGSLTVPEALTILELEALSAVNVLGAPEIDALSLGAEGCVEEADGETVLVPVTVGVGVSLSDGDSDALLESDPIGKLYPRLGRAQLRSGAGALQVAGLRVPLISKMLHICHHQ